jgi:hypothetical protein
LWVLVSAIVSSDCLRVRAFLNRFESCFHEFVYDGLVESAYLADEDFMCIGFYLSCMLVWNLVLNEMVALPKLMFFEVLQESDGWESCRSAFLCMLVFASDCRG